MDATNHRPDPDAPLATSASALRQQAEALTRDNEARLPDNIDALSLAETRRMLHELRVHQIELEMQNEELRRAQVELDASRARYFDLYDLAPVGYCTVSEAGLILQANLTAATLLGMARGALVNQRLSRFIVKADQDIFYLCRQQLIATGAPQACELRMMKQDGTHCWLRLATTAAQDDNGAPLLRMALTDVTERTRLDEVLQAKNVELERTKAVAEKANLAKSDFLSSMSHELRSPLHAILGFAQLMTLGSPLPTPTQKGNLDQILQAGWYLLELINEILDLALIESGKLALALPLSPVSLAEVMHECQDMIEAQGHKRGITVTFPQFEIPCFVYADRTRLKQVLINLLSNAIKYNKVNGAVIVDTIASTPGRIRITVKDSGAGLPPDKIAQLYQPFNRLGQEANAEEGTGIGLVITKRLVELMGGAVGVESTVGEGSVFWFEMNLATEHQSDANANANANANAAQSHTLLYVEDNPANLMLIEDLIARRPNIRFLSARDGNRGIEIARASLPDVILMDINLRGISGIQAMRILAEDPVTAHIPVIALSANAMLHDIEKGLAAGFFRYLTKPIKLDEFMATLDVALNFAKAESAK